MEDAATMPANNPDELKSPKSPQQRLHFLPAAPRRWLQAAEDFVRLLSGRFADTQCKQVAGSLTFTTLLALVPLVTVTLSLFSHFPAFADMGTALSDFLKQNILPDMAGQIVTTYALQFSEKAAQLTLIGTFGLLITVLMLLGTIEEVFNAIWGVCYPRPWLTRIMVYWVTLSLGPLVLAGSVLTTGKLVTTSVRLMGEAGSEVSVFFATLAPVSLLGCFFGFLYFAIPNHKVRLRHALSGGFVAAIAFVLMQQSFGFFIARFPTYTLIYGTFAALPIFLVWLYLSWLVVLLGALLAATLPVFMDRHQTITSAPGVRAWAAINLLASLAQAQNEGGALPLHTLRQHCGVSQNQAEHILDAMRQSGWVARTDEDEWVLAIAAHELRLSCVISLFALAPEPWLAQHHKASGQIAAARIQAALQNADCSLLELLQQANATPAAANQP